METGRPHLSTKPRPAGPNISLFSTPHFTFCSPVQTYRIFFHPNAAKEIFVMSVLSCHYSGEVLLVCKPREQWTNPWQLAGQACTRLTVSGT